MTSGAVLLLAELPEPRGASSSQHYAPSSRECRKKTRTHTETAIKTYFYFRPLTRNKLKHVCRSPQRPRLHPNVIH